MKIVNGIDVERAYTADEVAALHTQGKLRGVTLEGYVARADADGTCRFVPWHQSGFFNQEVDAPEEGKVTTQPFQGRTYVANTDLGEVMRQDVEAEHPMRRSTPQQKVARLMLRLMAEVKSSGTLPGFTQEHISQIAGESWKEGEPLSAEVVRRVAAHYMNVGEVENRKADDHRITKLHPLAHSTK